MIEMRPTTTSAKTRRQHWESFPYLQLLQVTAATADTSAGQTAAALTNCCKYIYLLIFLFFHLQFELRKRYNCELAKTKNAEGLRLGKHS